MYTDKKEWLSEDFIINDKEFDFFIFSKAPYSYSNGYKKAMGDWLSEKQDDIQKKMAAELYMEKDQMPYEGKCYNRADKKWRKKKKEI